MKITASEWARRHGMSRFWVCELCRAGRFATAEKVGISWMIDEHALAPRHLTRGPVPSVESETFKRMESRERKRMEYNERVAELDRRIQDAKQVASGNHWTARQNQIAQSIGEPGTSSACRIDAAGRIWASPTDQVGQFENWTAEDAAFYEAIGGDPV